MKLPELLAPVGSFDHLKVAVNAGASSVYLSGKKYGARKYAENFTLDEIDEAVKYAHLHNVKVYVTVNTLIKEDEIKDVLAYLNNLYAIGVDAVLIQDLGLVDLVNRYIPKLEIHGSTQMNIENQLKIDYIEKKGIKRIVLPREMSKSEIENIKTNMELEIFVHGALCYSYSGQCLFSSMKGGRSGNRGSCAQPCRQKYTLSDNKQTDCYLSLKDLSLYHYLEEIIQLGIDCIKIEGRMKTALYVGTVARTYRMAIDDYLESPDKYRENLPLYRKWISQCTYRQYTTGFFFGKPDETTQIYDSNTYIKEYTYLGIVGEEKDGHYRMEQRNKFSVGETIEVMKPNGENIEAEVLEILDEEGNRMESAPHPKQVLYINLGIKLEEYDILRRAEI